VSYRTIYLAGPDILAISQKIGTFIWTFLWNSPFWATMSDELLDLRSAFAQNARRSGIAPTAFAAEPFAIAKATPIRLKRGMLEGETSPRLYNSTSMPSIQLAVLVWKHLPVMSEALNSMISLTGSQKLGAFLDFVSLSVAGVTFTGGISVPTDDGYTYLEDAAKGIRGDFTGFASEDWEVQLSFLGKLAIKSEPAGKERVFAVVDAITQWLLKPLHRSVFDMLRRIPQDGTFNQLQPIELLLDRHRDEKVYVASLDLSAATDRLPVSLQETLLSHLFGERYASLWRTLLVSREYALPGVKPGRAVLSEVPEGDSVKYAVGQPMGALSSWAMLALTHHLLVQYSWYLVCQGQGKPYSWTAEYGVLGDDVVLVGRELSDSYQAVMKELGVGIGLHKSLISESSLTIEFAKRFYSEGVDASPISFAELDVASRSLSAALELRRRHNIKVSDFLRVLKVGPFAVSRLTAPVSRRVAAYVLALRWPFNDQQAIPSVLFDKHHPEPKGVVRWSMFGAIAIALGESLLTRALRAQELLESYQGTPAYSGIEQPLAYPRVSKWGSPSMMLLLAGSIDSSYADLYSPFGGYVSSCRKLDQFFTEFEAFTQWALTPELYDFPGLYQKWMHLRDLLALVRVPTADAEVLIEPPSEQETALEKVPETLQFWRVAEIWRARAYRLERQVAERKLHGTITWTASGFRQWDKAKLLQVMNLYDSAVSPKSKVL
jgi:hypothetical protein